jgi:hypothetical protein
MLNIEAARLDFDIDRDNARFDMNWPSSSELATHEANKARRAQIRKELS